mmetsp:Transcript_39697/g.64044  ORF Transcript_39697/g.64044 Transcript_39697/m.64044 type:complete len:155 (+) Transcript_39697:166-630(+)
MYIHFFGFASEFLCRTLSSSHLNFFIISSSASERRHIGAYAIAILQTYIHAYIHTYIYIYVYIFTSIQYMLDTWIYTFSSSAADGWRVGAYAISILQTLVHHVNETAVLEGCSNSLLVSKLLVHLGFLHMGARCDRNVDLKTRRKAPQKFDADA